MLHLNMENFETEVLKSEVPVLVDFFATWCVPCQMMGPVLEQLEAEYEGKIKIAKLDVDQAMDLAIKYQVMTVPNMIFFKGGEMVDRVASAVPAGFLKEKIDALI